MKLEDAISTSNVSCAPFASQAAFRLILFLREYYPNVTTEPAPMSRPFMSRPGVLGFLLLVIAFAIAAVQPAEAQDGQPAKAPDGQPAKAPECKIKPGEVIVPVGKGEQQLIFGELMSLDIKNRTGSFRIEGNDKIRPFTVLPYAELAHHGAKGDLQDFRIGERALFRFHQDTQGTWSWLTYLGDEMDFLANHSSYYWVDAVDPAKGEITVSRGAITVSRGNAPKTEWGEKGVPLITNAETRFWKSGQPAAFKDVQVGEKIRTRTHGVGSGKTRVCWEVFLDDESFKKFQEEQRAVHAKRMETEGLPAYVDSRNGKEVTLTLFQAGRDVFKTMTAGQKVRLAPAGVDRKPTGEPIPGTVTEVKPVRKLCKLSVTLDAAPAVGFLPPELVRVWVEKP
jgi:hypothetical protein